ncbi:MAG: ADP-ribosylglycohydrolase family protein [Lachnospiraceae bacterium]|nr:ADP-ribosylglycohydrolase family protein [Lachnospiraceae bacterium]
MIGAILGDIIGSRFEFDRGDKTKEFELFTEECSFTDDTVMTVAVGKALMDAGKDADTDEIEEAVQESMQTFGHGYPFAGYGARFIGWLAAGDEAKPYNSFGNGSAMRVSAAGLLYDSIERTREVARATANVSHNHPEGLKGAEATAAVMFLARTGVSKDEIRAYVSREFQYDLSRTLDEIRPGYHHVEDCQHTVPEAITAFLEGESYEDVIRNAVSLGGDTDTLAAIAGAMAEALYGVPEELKEKLEDYLPADLMDIVEEFLKYEKH